MKRQTKRWIIGVLILIYAFGAGVVYLQMGDKAFLTSCIPEEVLAVCLAYTWGSEKAVFPPMSPIPGKLMFDAADCVEMMETSDCCPKHFPPLSDFVCKSQKGGPSKKALENRIDLNAVDDWSYVYLGYYLENEEQGMAFIEAYREFVRSGIPLEWTLQTPPGDGNCGSDKLQRLSVWPLLRELSCLAERAAEIPVVLEWPGNHRDPGGFVVYLDGHREFVPYPGKFPMTERFVEGLKELDRIQEDGSAGLTQKM